MGVIIRQSIKGTIVNYFGTFIGFITTFFVLTNYLTAEEIGLTRVLVDTATLFIGLAQLGTNSSIIRFYPYFKNKETNDNGFFFWTLVIPLIGFIIFGVIYIALKVPISNLFIEKSPLFVDYYYFILPLSFFMLYQVIFETNSNVLMNIVVPKFVREVLIRVLSLIAYLLYAFKVVTIDGFVIVFCSMYAIAALCNVIYLVIIKKVSFKPSFKKIPKSILKDYLFYTLFLITSALGSAIIPSVNTFFISAQMGLAFTGIYAIANYMTAMIGIPYRSLGAIAGPQLSQEIKDNNIAGANKLCRDVSLHQLIAGAFIFFTIWINIDIIFELLPNGETYASAKWVVLILGWSQIISSSLSIGTSVLSFSKYFYYSLVFTFIVAIAAIILNNIFVPMFGINGAALATLLSTVIQYFLPLAVIWFKIKTSPFSLAQLKLLAVIAILALLNQLTVSFITPHFINIMLLPELYAEIIESALRTVVLLSLGVFTVYRWGISQMFNTLIKRVLKFI